MQAAKDSFFRALQSRLAMVNPARTVVIDGIARPAILVTENEAHPPPKLFFQAYYIHWLGAPIVQEFAGTNPPRYELLSQIEYFVQGTSSLVRPYADRGRLIGQMDEELVQILFPGFTAKLDYTVTPPASLGSTVQWRWTPDFRTEAEGNGSVLRRMATVLVSFPLETIPN